jgi:hypothetical protein
VMGVVVRAVAVMAMKRVRDLCVFMMFWLLNSSYFLFADL